MGQERTDGTADDDILPQALDRRGDPMSEPVNILVAFYSRSGSVEALAGAVAEGARKAGATVRLRRVRELVGPETMRLAPGWTEAAERMNALYEAPTVDDAKWADGFVFGAPTRFGAAASELRAYFETLGALWFGGDLIDKAAGVFAATSAPHGGLETTALGLYPTLAHLGMIIVPNGYGHPALFRAGTPYGAGSNSHGAEMRPPSQDDLDIAAYQGERVARVAAALKAARAKASG
jgi:NAD(P)H dehydrogenase (quinone)